MNAGVSVNQDALANEPMSAVAWGAAVVIEMKRSL